MIEMIKWSLLAMDEAATSFQQVGGKWDIVLTQGELTSRLTKGKINLACKVKLKIGQWKMIFNTWGHDMGWNGTLSHSTHNGIQKSVCKYKRHHEDYLCQHAGMYVALGSWLGERLDMQRGGRVVLLVFHAMRTHSRLQGGMVTSCNGCCNWHQSKSVGVSTLGTNVGISTLGTW